MFKINPTENKVEAELHFSHTSECREFVTKMCKLNLEYPVEISFKVDKASRQLHICLPIDDDNRDNLDLMIAHLSDVKDQYLCAVKN